MRTIQGPDGTLSIIFDRFGGLNLKSDPSVTEGGIQPEQALEAVNVDFRDGVSLQSRDGYARRIANTYSKNVTGIYPFYVSDVRHLMVMTWDGANYDLFDSTTSKDTGNTTTKPNFFPASYNDYMYIPGADDDEDYNSKYDGTTITKMGIDAPTDQCSGVVASPSEFLYLPIGSSVEYNLDRFAADNSYSIAGSWTAGSAISGMISYNGKIYFSSFTGKLYEFSAGVITEVAPPWWSGVNIVSLCLSGTTIYGADNNSGKLLKWDGPSDTVWEEAADNYAGETSLRSLLLSGGNIYCGGGTTGKLLMLNTGALDLKAGQYGSETDIEALIEFGGKIYGLSYPTGYLLEYDSGTSAWLNKGNMATPGSALISFGGSLYASSSNGKLYIWNGTDTLTQVAVALASATIQDLKLFNSKIYGFGYISGTSYTSVVYSSSGGAWTSEKTFTPSTIHSAFLNFTPSAGDLTGVYQYYYSYYNSTTGHESALSPISNAVTATAQQINLSGIDASSDSQVDYKRIYRTGGTRQTINYLAQIANATTTYSDNTADAAVGNIEDCDKNDVLAKIKAFWMHHHQLFGAYNATNKGYVYDSRFYKPEAFPATYFYKVGNSTNPVVAVMALDIDIIIYTRYSTYRLRYIGTAEGDTALEELAPVGLVSCASLCSGVTVEGQPYHIFFGQSARQRGIYILNVSGTMTCISQAVDPLFTGERGAEDPIAQVTAIAWAYADTCCAVFAKNKYLLAYPEAGLTTPNKVLVADMNFTPPMFYTYSIAMRTICYDIIGDPTTKVDEIIFGGNTKEVYYFTGTTDWVSGAAAGIAVSYQTAYFGDGNSYRYLKSIVFRANTRSATLTVKVYADFALKATLTCSSSSLDRIELSCPKECFGRIFSIRFEYTGSTTANRRLKICAPMECKFSPVGRY